jgi:hypothetical protein
MERTIINFNKQAFCLSLTKRNRQLKILRKKIKKEKMLKRRVKGRSRR